MEEPLTAYADPQPSRLGQRSLLQREEPSWTHEVPRIAAPRLSITDRAGRWATVQVDRARRAVNDVAAEPGGDWHAISDAVIAYGTAGLAPPARRIRSQ